MLGRACDVKVHLHGLRQRGLRCRAFVFWRRQQRAGCGRGVFTVAVIFVSSYTYILQLHKHMFINCNASKAANANEVSRTCATLPTSRHVPTSKINSQHAHMKGSL